LALALNEDPLAMDTFRIPFGIITSNNIELYDYYEKIGDVSINNIEAIAYTPPDNNLDLDISFQLSWNLLVDFSAINQTNSFGYITNTTNQNIYNQIKNFLILPNTSVKQNIKLSTNVHSLDFDIDYQLNSTTAKSKHIKISLPNRDEFYLKLGIGLFIISFITIVIGRFVYVTVFKKKRIGSLYLWIKKHVRKVYARKPLST
jgi:hypothetical protein